MQILHAFIPACLLQQGRGSGHAVGICHWTEREPVAPAVEPEEEVLGESVSMWERHLLMREQVRKQ